jgi:hypothetical protein
MGNWERGMGNPSVSGPEKRALSFEFRVSGFEFGLGFPVKRGQP